MLSYLIKDEMIENNDRIAVGVSGGADSMLLLTSLMDFKKVKDFYFKAVHINHHLRDDESERDSEFVKSFCEEKGIDLTIVDVDVKALRQMQKKGVEESARIARYDALFSVMKKDKLTKLFLAHHANDQAETIMMHIFRGAGISGASGIRSNAVIIRPFMGIKKSEILNICQENGIEYVTDSSNRDNSYTRNYIRNVVIPDIEKVYPHAVDMICAFGERCNEIQTFIESQIEYTLIVHRKDSVLIKERAFKSPSFVLREYLKKAFEEIKIYSNIEQKHYKMLEELILLPVNSMMHLPNGIVAKRVYEGIALYKKQVKKNAMSEHLFCKGETIIEGYGKIIVEIVHHEDVCYGDGSLYVDYYKIPVNAVWRCRKQGDMFAKLGSGTKRLNDYLTDKKIEANDRDSIPVLAKNEKVFVVAGVNISENVKIDSGTDKIAKITFIQN